MSLSLVDARATPKPPSAFCEATSHFTVAAPGDTWADRQRQHAERRVADVPGDRAVGAPACRGSGRSGPCRRSRAATCPAAPAPTPSARPRRSRSPLRSLVRGRASDRRGGGRRAGCGRRGRGRAPPSRCRACSTPSPNGAEAAVAVLRRHAATARRGSAGDADAAARPAASASAIAAAGRAPPAHLEAAPVAAQRADERPGPISRQKTTLPIAWARL